MVSTMAVGHSSSVSSPGSGCQLLEDVITKTIERNVTVSQYKEFLQPYLDDKPSEQAAEQLKQCFLSQSDETLANVQQLMVIFPSSFIPLKSLTWKE